MTSQTSAENKTLLQTFEWHTPRDHYTRLTRLLPSLAELGITDLWLPPGCKAANPEGNGYDIYDLWDLGDFDQKGSRRTKWGSGEELTELLEKAKELGMDTIWDAVINHKQGGDATEKTWAVEVDKEDRRYEICPPKKIEAWLRYDFPGRNEKYSKMQWRAEHFNGVDWDQRAERHALYKLIDDPALLSQPFKQPVRPKPAVKRPAIPRSSLWNRLSSLAAREVPSTTTSTIPARRPGKGWADDVDKEHGNNDYLLFSNIDYSHPEVREEVLDWGKWMIHDVGVDGFRLDAVQHFSFNFTRDWIQAVNEASKQERKGRDAFVVGEIWSGDVNRILRWLDVVQRPKGPQVYAYDSPLLYNFSRISEDVRKRSKNSDLRTILRDSLLCHRPKAAVTLVTNHDTQPGQTCYTPMDSQYKKLFYAFILLRQEGYPCVFWGGLYGTKGPHAEPPACRVLDRMRKDGNRSLLPDLIMCRKLFAYGEQTDYWDSSSILSWTRAGTKDRSGCAVMLSIEPAGKLSRKKMKIGKPGEIWIDVLKTGDEEVEIGATGHGEFPCKGSTAAVFVRKDAVGVKRFPVGFDLDVYGS